VLWACRRRESGSRHAHGAAARSSGLASPCAAAHDVTFLELWEGWIVEPVPAQYAAARRTPEQLQLVQPVRIQAEVAATAQAVVGGSPNFFQHVRTAASRQQVPDSQAPLICCSPPALTRYDRIASRRRVRAVHTAQAKSPRDQVSGAASRRAPGLEKTFAISRGHTSIESITPRSITPEGDGKKAVDDGALDILAAKPVSYSLGPDPLSDEILHTSLYELLKFRTDLANSHPGAVSCASRAPKPNPSWSACVRRANVTRSIRAVHGDHRHGPEISNSTIILPGSSRISQSRDMADMFKIGPRECKPDAQLDPQALPHPRLPRLGLDGGPMSVFDNARSMPRVFFACTPLKSILFCRSARDDGAVVSAHPRLTFARPAGIV